MKTILIVGSNGQLGSCFKAIEKENTSYKFLFKDAFELDITNADLVSEVFLKNNIDYCINCAAYTDVDKAETEKELAYKINVSGAKNLAIACKKQDAKMLHVSTDFVFDGKKTTSYTEEDLPNPQNVYGKTKLKGEQEVIKHLAKHYIIRTSWLYSEFGSNFIKTMLRLSETKNELSIVNDQIGTPTYAPDLAKAILTIIKSNKQAYGLYHYSNQGKASWYDFAKEIFKANNVEITLNGIPTSAYPTPAKRPKYSVLSKEKIKTTFDLEIPNWRDSLKSAIKNNISKDI